MTESVHLLMIYLLRIPFIARAGGWENSHRELDMDNNRSSLGFLFPLLPFSFLGNLHSVILLGFISSHHHPRCDH